VLDALADNLHYIVPVVLFGGVGAVLAWGMLRKREQVREAVQAAARALALPEKPAPHRRMQLFAGPVMDLRAEVASHALYTALYDPGPFQPMLDPNIIARVRLPAPLPAACRIDSSRGAESNFDAASTGLHWIFKAWTQQPDALSKLLANKALVDDVNRLFGETPEGSGRIVRLDERGVYAYYNVPTPEGAVQLVQQMVKVANLLAQRAAFAR
jgi:hypothetical protein